jgi:hypothetical protein
MNIRIRLAGVLLLSLLSLNPAAAASVRLDKNAAIASPGGQLST